MYQFPSSGGRSASVSSASASQSTHATPVNVSLTAGDSARIAIKVSTQKAQSNVPPQISPFERGKAKKFGAGIVKIVACNAHRFGLRYLAFSDHLG